MNGASKNQSQLCNLCKNNIEIDKLQDHLIEHEMENGTVSCAVCSSIFTSLVGLKDHIRDHNLTALDLKEVCPKCSSRFLYQSELAHHLHEHDQAENNNNPPVKQEEEIQISSVIKDIKEEEDDDYIEIEKVAENSV